MSKLADVLVALLRNSRKTERGAGQFLVRLAVRAAPFALPSGRGSVFMHITPRPRLPGEITGYLVS
jgi:hypothetical protein